MPAPAPSHAEQVSIRRFGDHPLLPSGATRYRLWGPVPPQVGAIGLPLAQLFLNGAVPLTSRVSFGSDPDGVLDVPVHDPLGVEAGAGPSAATACRTLGTDHKRVPWARDAYGGAYPQGAHVTTAPLSTPE